MTEWFTDEEGAIPHPDTVKEEEKKRAAAKPRQFFTDEEGAVPYQAPQKPDSERKFLDNNNDGWTSGAAKGIATHAIKGGLALYPPTWPGSIRDFGSMIEAGAENYLRKGYNAFPGTENVEDPGTAALMQRNHEAMPEFVQQFPNVQETYETGKGIPGMIAPKDYVGEYKPESMLGRVGGAMVESVIARNPKRLLNIGEAAGAATAAGAASAVGDVTGDPIAAMAAGIATPKLVAGAGQRVYDRVSPTSPGTELARRVAQETPDDPLGVAGRMNAKPNPITQSNMVMQSQDRGVAALNKVLEKGDENYKAYNDGVENTNTELVGAADEKIRAPAVAQVEQDLAARTAGLSGTTKSEAGTDVHSVTDTLWDADKASERAKWDAWRNRGDGIVKYDQVKNGLDAYVASLPIRDRKLLQDEFDVTKQDLAERATRNTSDVVAIQDLRSKLLKMARDTKDGGERTVYNNAAERLRDIMMDQNNYRFNSGKNRTAWDEAVKTTKDFHDTWGDKTTQWMKDGTKDEGAFLNRVFRNPDAGKRTAELMAKVGSDPQVLQSIEDWHMSDLTNGGTKIPKPEAVEAYIAKNGHIISQIPGLQQKLMDFGYLTRKQQVGQMWDSAQSSPKKLVQFLENNRDEVYDVTGNKVAVDGLEQAARQLEALTNKQPGAVNSETFNEMQKGRTSTLLYGATLGGNVGKVALAALAYHLMPEAVGVEAFLGALGAAGVAGHYAGAGHHAVGKLVDAISTGQARERAEQILREALKDPKKWEELRRMGPRETAQTLFGSGQGLTPSFGTAVGAAIGTHDGVTANQERTSDE